MGLFRHAQSAALVGEELFTVAEALEHSVRTLEALPSLTAGQASAVARRTVILKRLRRAMIS